MSELRGEDRLASCRLTLPEGQFDSVKLTFTSEYGMSGCQGLVMPAILEVNGERTAVQAKRFYRNTFDDRGDQFFQNPDEEATNSYEALLKLKALGFRVLPFFGLMDFGDGENKGKLLVMTDLTAQGQHEIIDEKAIHRSEMKVEVLKDGQMVKTSGSEVLRNLNNAPQVELGFLHTVMLQYAHDVHFGWPGGVAHMMVRDPATNMGELVIVDVGEFWLEKSKYKEGVPFDELIQVPEDEVKGVFDKILAQFHQDLDPSLVFDFYSESLLKKTFHDLYYQAAVGMAVTDHLGSIGNDLEWGRQRFVRTDFSDHILRTKKKLYELADAYKHQASEPLFNLNIDSIDRFMNPRAPEDLMIGIDISYLAVIDRRMQYLAQARDAIKQEEPATGGLPSIEFGSNGLPVMRFFDNYYEVKDIDLIKCVVDITGHGFSSRDWIQISVEVDWKTGERISRSGGTSYVPLLTPDQFKGLQINKEKIDYDPAKLALYAWGLPLERGDRVNYLYDGEVIYSDQVTSDKDIELIIPHLANEVSSKS